MRRPLGTPAKRGKANNKEIIMGFLEGVFGAIVDFFGGIFEWIADLFNGLFGIF